MKINTPEDFAIIFKVNNFCRQEFSSLIHALSKIVLVLKEIICSFLW